MKKLLIALLLVVALAVPALAATLKPADVIGANTRFAIVSSGLPGASIRQSLDKGDFTREGVATGLGEGIEVNSLTEGLMLLNSGRADAILTVTPTAEYIVARNEGLNAVEGVYPLDLCMLIANDKPELLASINEAIAAMTEDGTLMALWVKHITSLAAGAEPEAIEAPAIEGAPVVRVGISGDLPPMDYVSADGKPAGYNTAILAEIAKRANFQLEFVYMESGARFMALQTGRIDVFFWQLDLTATMADDAFQGDGEALKNDTIGCLVSDTYATTPIGWIVKGNPLTDEALIRRAKTAAEWVAAHPNATTMEIQAYCIELGVDDICTTDANGVIVFSNQEANIGFNFADDAQSAEFLPILTDPTLEIVQKPTPRGADGELYRYAGVAGGIEGGLTQVGVLSPAN